jgi:nucleotide-binding universal stress UspA family protein
MILLKRILVPVDFSDTAQAAVKYGSALAKQFQASLILLHVEERREYEVIVEGERVVEETLAPGVSPPKTDDIVHSAARMLIGRLLTPEDETTLRAEYELLASGPGGPAAEIMRFAKEREIDLIVIGTHGRGGVQHLLMGSVAESVVRGASCPVLVVRPHEHEFVV